VAPIPRNEGFASSAGVAGKESLRFSGAKWTKELDYRLIKELWAFEGNHIAVRCA
jgi:hypothetical protein